MKHILLAFALALLAAAAAPADDVRSKPLTLHVPPATSRPCGTRCCRNCKTPLPATLPITTARPSRT